MLKFREYRGEGKAGTQKCGGNRDVNPHFQVTGEDFGPVRKRLAGSPSEFWEGTPSMESAGETSSEGGGGATSVCNVLLGSGPGSITFWGRDLDFFRGDVLEDGGGARGNPKSDNSTEGSAEEGRDLAMCGSRKGP